MLEKQGNYCELICIPFSIALQPTTKLVLTFVSNCLNRSFEVHWWGFVKCAARMAAMNVFLLETLTLLP